MEPIYTESEARPGNVPIDQRLKHRDVVWFERQPVRNLRSLHRLNEDGDTSLDGFTSAFGDEREEPGGVRFGFLKISAIREIVPERIEVELELAAGNHSVWHRS